MLLGLQGKEAGLAENGRFREALALRQVHEKLSQLPGDTLEEMFDALILSKDRAIVELVQGPCSEEIAETIEALTQVGKLVNPVSVNPVREDADSLVIGGVVLKRKGVSACDCRRHLALCNS